MNSISDEKKKKFLLNLAFFAAILLLAWVCLKYLLPVLLPFILGYLIAALAQPLAGFMHRRIRMERKASGVIAVLIFIFLLGAAVTFGLSRLITELSAVFAMLPSFISGLMDAFESFTSRFSGMMNQLPLDLSQKVTSALSGLSTELTKMSEITSGLASVAKGTAGRIPGILFATIVTIVSACFISGDYPEIRGFFMRQLPEGNKVGRRTLKVFSFLPWQG